MADSGDDDKQQQAEARALTDRAVALERELHRVRCEHRRVCEELDYANERERVLRRVIERLI